MMIVSFWI